MQILKLIFSYDAAILVQTCQFDHFNFTSAKIIGSLWRWLMWTNQTCDICEHDVMHWPPTPVVCARDPEYLIGSCIYDGSTNSQTTKDGYRFKPKEHCFESLALHRFLYQVPFCKGGGESFARCNCLKFSMHLQSSYFRKIHITRIDLSNCIILLRVSVFGL